MTINIEMNGTFKELLVDIKTNFVARLSNKTGWGRSEIIAAYDNAVIDAIISKVDHFCPSQEHRDDIAKALTKV